MRRLVTLLTTTTTTALLLLTVVGVGGEQLQQPSPQDSNDTDTTDEVDMALTQPQRLVLHSRYHDMHQSPPPLTKLTGKEHADTFLSLGLGAGSFYGFYGLQELQPSRATPPHVVHHEEPPFDPRVTMHTDGGYVRFEGGGGGEEGLEHGTTATTGAGAGAGAGGGTEVRYVTRTRLYLTSDHDAVLMGFASPRHHFETQQQLEAGDSTAAAAAAGSPPRNLSAAAVNMLGEMYARGLRESPVIVVTERGLAMTPAIPYDMQPLPLPPPPPPQQQRQEDTGMQQSHVSLDAMKVMAWTGSAATHLALLGGNVSGWKKETSRDRWGDHDLTNATLDPPNSGDNATVTVKEADERFGDNETRRGCVVVTVTGAGAGAAVAVHARAGRCYVIHLDASFTVDVRPQQQQGGATMGGVGAGSPMDADVEVGGFAWGGGMSYTHPAMAVHRDKFPPTFHPAHAPALPSLTSPAPERVDLHLVVTEAGFVTVAAWEEGNVSGPPLAGVNLTGAANLASSERLIRKATSELVAYQHIGPSPIMSTVGQPIGPTVMAAMLDEVTASPRSAAAVATPCCAPNATSLLPAPDSPTAAALVYTARNGSHEWAPGSHPPHLPPVLLHLEMGSCESDGLDGGVTDAKVGALQMAAASASGVGVGDVHAMTTGDHSLTHDIRPHINITGISASWINEEAARKEILRVEFASAAGVSPSSVRVGDVLEAQDSTAESQKSTVRFLVSGIANATVVENVVNTVKSDAFATALLSTLKQVEGMTSATLLSGHGSSQGPGGSGCGVIARLTFNVTAKTEGAWIALTYGGGVTAARVNHAMSPSSPDAVHVAQVHWEINATSAAGVGGAGPGPYLSPIRDDGARLAFDVVHQPGAPRQQSLFATHVDTGQVLRVSWHNQRPGARLLAVVSFSDAAGNHAPLWNARVQVAAALPPSPPEPPSPPPRVEQLETRIVSGPAEGSISPPGTTFVFQLEALPSCGECGLPAATAVHVRVARESGTSALAWGDWEPAVTINEEETVTVDGEVVTRMVPKLEYRKYVEMASVWRLQAKAVDAGVGAELQDTTPVERRWIVGARVSATGKLDRSTGMVAVAFTAPVAEATRAMTPEQLLSPASLATFGPGPVTATWANASSLHLHLPPAHLTGICSAWRASRSAATRAWEAAEEEDKAKWNGPLSLRPPFPPPNLPGAVNVTFRDPAAMFESNSGNVYEGEVHVDMGATQGNSGVILSGPRDVGGCQQLRLDVGRTDGSWDGVLRWTLESATNATPGATNGSNHAELVTLIETTSLGKTIVNVPPEMTAVDMKYAFGVSLTNCHGNVSESELVVTRRQGMIPGVYPTSGATAYALDYSAPLTVAMEVTLPTTTLTAPGSECAMDASSLTYEWRNLSGPADCLYGTELSKFGWYKLAPRANQRTLTLPPFCLQRQDAPHRLQLRAFFGSGTAAAITEVHVTVRRSPVKAVLAGGAGPRVVPNGANLVLDASGSYDPDAAAPGAPRKNETFTWSCVNLVTGAGGGTTEQPCSEEFAQQISRSQGSKLTDIGSFLLVGYRYKFTVRYGNQNAYDTASTEVSVVVDPVPTVTVSTPEAASVASTAPLRLQGTATRTSGTGAITFYWEASPAVDFTAADNFLTPVNSPSLVIKGGVLTPGTSYVFTLKAKQAGMTLEGSATTGAIAVIGPPTPGRMFTDPSSGDALSTMFTVGTSGWTVGADAAGGDVATGSLRYTMGYVAAGAGGADTEVIMSSRSAATTFAGLLPANVTANGAVADARVFAYAEAAGVGGGRGRVEGNVRVTPVVGKGSSEVAADALKAAMKLGDPTLRAAAAVTAAASLNTRSPGAGVKSAALNASEIAARKEVRAGAMKAVADATDALLADTTLELEPEVLSSHVNAIAAVAAAPAELTISTASRGVETIAGLLRAKASQPADAVTARTATSMLSGAIQVVLLNNGGKTPPPPPPPSSNATSATAASVRRHLTRRLMQSPVVTNGTTYSSTDDVPPSQIDPLVAKALDGSVALASAVVRGQAPGETGTRIEEEHVCISASRHPPGDLAGAGGPFQAPHKAAGSYYLPPNLAAAVATHTHADLFLFRVNGAMLPSATRIMSDGSSVDVIGEDGLRPGLPDTDEITVHVPLVGSGLQTLEKMLYEYRCARHVAGVWNPDDPLVRTVSVTETAPGVGHVTCAGKGVAFLGYMVGAVIAPINFTLTKQIGEEKPTQDVYWIVMAATMGVGLLFGAVALFCGMWRHTAKVANKDRGSAYSAS